MANKTVKNVPAVVDNNIPAVLVDTNEEINRKFSLIVAFDAEQAGDSVNLNNMTLVFTGGVDKELMDLMVSKFKEKFALADDSINTDIYQHPYFS
jgi:hypothetical protein